MITILNGPAIAVNGNLSKWFPAHQPISFKLKREDAKVLQRYKIDNEIHFKMSSVPTSVKAGQTITYVRNTVTVTLVINSIVGNYIKVPFTASFNTGVMGVMLFSDAYLGYHVETRVSYIDASLTYRTIGTLKTKTDSFGISKVSVQELLKTKLDNSNLFLYDKINRKQLNEGSGFNIQVREIYNDYTSSWSSLSSNNANYFVNGSKQLQDPNNYNMGEFVTKLNFAENKFLSVFSKPTYFVGYPFSLSFIYSDLLLNMQITRNEETFDLNNGTVATTVDNLISSDLRNVNRLMLKQSYPSTVKTLQVWLSSTGIATINNIVSKDTYVRDAFKLIGPQINIKTIL